LNAPCHPRSKQELRQETDEDLEMNTTAPNHSLGKIMKTLLRLLKRHVAVLLGRELRLRPRIRLDTEFHGSSYGGWAIKRDSLSDRSHVISVGVGEDASFDLSLISKYRCRILALDPTPKAVEWVHTNISSPFFQFEPLALSAADGKLKLYLPKNTAHVSASMTQSDHNQDTFFEAPCVRVSTLLGQFAYSRVDVFKMDIEGAEYGVIRDMITSGACDLVEQLLVEFHHHFSGFSVRDTKEAIAGLAQTGLQIAWVSSSGHEVLFARA
jgi:FkbM family methyltransferase